MMTVTKRRRVWKLTAKEEHIGEIVYVEDSVSETSGSANAATSYTSDASWEKRHRNTSQDLGQWQRRRRRWQERRTSRRSGR